MTDPDLLSRLAHERADEVARQIRFQPCCRVGAAEVFAAWRRSFTVTLAFLTGTPLN